MWVLWSPRDSSYQRIWKKKKHSNTIYLKSQKPTWNSIKGCFFVLTTNFHIKWWNKRQAFLLTSALSKALVPWDVHWDPMTMKRITSHQTRLEKTINWQDFSRWSLKKNSLPLSRWLGCSRVAHHGQRGRCISHTLHTSHAAWSFAVTARLAWCCFIRSKNWLYHLVFLKFTLYIAYIYIAYSNNSYDMIR